MGAVETGPSDSSAQPRNIFLPEWRLNLKGKVWQAGRKPSVVALHGWLDHADSFSRVAPLLQAEVWAVDLPGHGLSDHFPAGLSYTFMDTVSVLYELIEQLPQPITLLGHSLGAAVASFIAALQGVQKVQRLILIDALGPLDEQAEKTFSRMHSHFQYRFHRQSKKVSYHSKEAAIMVRQRANVLDQDTARILVERSLKKNGDEYHWRSDSRLRWPSLVRMTNEQIVNVLQKINIETLLLLATNKDQEATRRQTDLYYSRIQALKNLKIHRLEGHHHLHLQHPHDVAELINHFIASHDAY